MSFPPPGHRTDGVIQVSHGIFGKDYKKIDIRLPGNIMPSCAAAIKNNRHESIAEDIFIVIDDLRKYFRRIFRYLCHVFTPLKIAACAAGMACKEVMVAAPLVVLLYDRTFLAGSFRAAWRRGTSPWSARRTPSAPSACWW